jgi:hypothetical protein
VVINNEKSGFRENLRILTPEYILYFHIVHWEKTGVEEP